MLGGPGDLLPDDRAHRAPHESIVHDREDDRNPLDLGLDDAHRVGDAERLLVRLEAIDVTLRIGESEGVGGAHLSEELAGFCLVDEELDPL